MNSWLRQVCWLFPIALSLGTLKIIHRSRECAENDRERNKENCGLDQLLLAQSAINSNITFLSILPSISTVNFPELLSVMFSFLNSIYHNWRSFIHLFMSLILPIEWKLCYSKNHIYYTHNYILAAITFFSHYAYYFAYHYAYFSHYIHNLFQLVFILTP